MIRKRPICQYTHYKYNNRNKQTINMNKEINYEKAVAQLEDIVRRMESGELDIDSLCEQLKTAKQLIKQCKDKLTKTDEQIKKLLDD